MVTTCSPSAEYSELPQIGLPQDARAAPPPRPPAGEPARPPTIADLLAGLKGEIDAPERGQPFYKQSKESLAEMCFGKPAKLKQTSYDSRFNRPVVRMQCGELDTNLEQVRHGMAWVFDKYVTDKSLYPIQDEARSARHGLWVDESPVPPWEWRKRARQNLSDAGESLEHGGGLNTCGCHFNRKTGECHCHQPRQCGCECQPAECRR